MKSEIRRNKGTNERQVQVFQTGSKKEYSRRVELVLSGKGGGRDAGGAAGKVTGGNANWSWILCSSKLSPEGDSTKSECEYGSTPKSRLRSLARASETLPCGPVLTIVTVTPPLLLV